MTIQYGLTMDNQNLIIEKAKTKKDGFYTLRGVAYKVKDNKVEFFAMNNGEVIQMCYGFNVVIGAFEYNWDGDNMKALKKLCG